VAAITVGGPAPEAESETGDGLSGA